MRPLSGTPNAAGTALQVVAIAVIALILSTIAHKAYVDVSALAHKHSGQEFWVALARYFIGNLAGGGKPPENG
jgi:hypothetical protein